MKTHTRESLRQWREQHGLSRRAMAILVRSKSNKGRTVEKWELGTLKVPTWLSPFLYLVEDPNGRGAAMIQEAKDQAEHALANGR